MISKVLGLLQPAVPASGDDVLPPVGNIEHSFWLPIQGTDMAKDVDMAWDWAMYTSIFFFVLIVGAMTYFVFKYRRKREGELTNPIDHSTKLEVTWSVLPLLMCIALFFVGLKGYVNASVPPGETFDIHVVAQRWRWDFIYPDGTVTSSEVAFPRGRRIKLIMSSTDVLHSFYVPAFRVKQDVVPSMYTTLWFEPNQTMETVLLCTEYCGKDHSKMLAKAIVLEQPQFEEWLVVQNKVEPTAEAGAKIYVQKGCPACHGGAGEGGQGPKLQGLFGRTEQTSAGPITVDENYLRESILDPNAKIVNGYPSGLMPPGQGAIKDKQILALIEFIKSLK